MLIYRIEHKLEKAKNLYPNIMRIPLSEFYKLKRFEKKMFESC